jgi:hypothetical protein
MVSCGERTLPMQRSLLTNGAYASDPVLINDLIIVPWGLLLRLFGDRILRGGPRSSRRGRDGVMSPNAT